MALGVSDLIAEKVLLAEDTIDKLDPALTEAEAVSDENKLR